MLGLDLKEIQVYPLFANDDTTDRYSLKIDFGQYVDRTDLSWNKKTHLNNNISDATYMKEAISYDIYNFLGFLLQSILIQT